MHMDMFNGLLEFVGSLMLWLNVRALYKDKQVKGVNWLTTLFFTGWGVWNLAYYPSLGQWWSFAGGISLALANLAWLVLLLKYRRL